MTTRSISHLTTRELSVLKRLTQGLTNQEIADQLVISVSTVQNHLHSIFSKLYVRNRTSAVFVAHQQGLIEIEKMDDFNQASIRL